MIYLGYRITYNPTICQFVAQSIGGPPFRTLYSPSLVELKAKVRSA